MYLKIIFTTQSYSRAAPSLYETCYQQSMVKVHVCFNLFSVCIYSYKWYLHNEFLSDLYRDISVLLNGCYYNQTISEPGQQCFNLMTNISTLSGSCYTDQKYQNMQHDHTHIIHQNTQCDHTHTAICLNATASELNAQGTRLTHAASQQRFGKVFPTCTTKRYY